MYKIKNKLYQPLDGFASSGSLTPCTQTRKFPAVSCLENPLSFFPRVDVMPIVIFVIFASEVERAIFILLYIRKTIEVYYIYK